MVRLGSVLVDMMIIKFSLVVEIYKQFQEKGIFIVDVLVFGGDVGVKNGMLFIMVGGDKDIVDEIMFLLDIMGGNIIYEGGVGVGQYIKMCNQIMIVGIMIGVCESLLYVYKFGLDLEVMLQVISGGVVGCWILSNLVLWVVVWNFEFGFYVEYFVKDMEIVLDEVKCMNLFLFGLVLVY